MNAPHLTLLFAGLCALLQTLLTALVISRRKQSGVNLQDGGDPTLIRRIRAHGNFVETAPMALLLMGLLEMNGLATNCLWGFGILLVVGRSLHAYGLLFSHASWARKVGMFMTIFVISIEGVVSVWLFAR